MEQGVKLAPLSEEEKPKLEEDLVKVLEQHNAKLVPGIHIDKIKGIFPILEVYKVVPNEQEPDTKTEVGSEEGAGEPAKG